MDLLARRTLPRPGLRIVGGRPVPRDLAGEAVIAAKDHRSQAGLLASAAERARNDASTAKIAAESALADARRALAEVQTAVASGRTTLDAHAADLVIRAQAAVAAAELARGAAEAALANAEATARLVAGQVEASLTAARTAREQAALAGERASSLVGIKWWGWQGDDIVIVLTDGQIIRKNMRGPRGYGTAGLAGTDGRGILSVTIRPSDYHLIVTFDGGQVFDAGALADIGRRVRTTSANDVFGVTDDVLLVNAAAGDRTIQVNPATFWNGATMRSRDINIKRISPTGGNVIITPTSGLIERATSLTLTGNRLPAACLVTDGTDLWIAL